MRSNTVWHSFIFFSKLRLLWTRITSSKITTFYFIFSLLHCIIQIIFQVEAYLINAEAVDFLTNIIKQGDAFDTGFSVLTSQGLRVCNSPVPKTFSVATCKLVWDGVPANDTVVGAVNNASDDMNNGSSESSSIQTTSTNIGSPKEFMAPTITISSSSAIAKASTVRDIVTETITVTSFVKAMPSSKDVSSQDTESISSFLPKSTDASLKQRQYKAYEVDKYNKERSKRAEQISTDGVNNTKSVIIDGFGWNNQSVVVDQACLYALNWPVEKLSDTEREDITFILFQIWVLSMSVVAILNESMPHIITSLLTHFMASGWAGYQLSKTEIFHRDFTFLTTQGACKPINLLPEYWKRRGDAEIPILALNAFSLLLSAVLSWKLIRFFGWQTFKRVGASRTINRVYRLVLSLSIAIQLSVFFVSASIVLWIDQLYHGSIGRLATADHIFTPVLITVLILLVPWLTMGWIAVRREKRRLMLVFLIMSFGYLGGWSAMFDSPTFRWTFFQWELFAVVTAVSVALMLMTLILGIICRINFGKGLVHHLNPRAHMLLSDEKFDRTSSQASIVSYEEKIEFPSATSSLPIYRNSAHYSSPPLGPRFTNPSLQPFESTLRPLVLAHTRPLSVRSNSFPTIDNPGVNYPMPSHSRENRGSLGSIDSYYTNSSQYTHSEQLPISNHWVIE